MKYLIVGFGLTGRSCAEFLSSQGNTVIVVDDNLGSIGLAKCKAKYPSIRFESVATAKTLANIDYMLPSPGVSPEHYCIKYARENRLKIITDLDLFAANTKANYILVTGTNGKSTVVTLLSRMLSAAGQKVAVGGNIGIPILDCLDFDWVVIEVSSFTLYYANSLKAAAGVLLNIGNDHLNWHGSFENYLAAKSKVYDFSLKKICNIEQSVNICKEHIYFGRSNKADWQIADCGDILNTGRVVVSKADYLVSQAGLAENIAACAAIFSSLGFSIDNILIGVRSFVGLEYRCQLVSRYNNIYWINDSKATNLHAVIAAVNSVNSQYGKDIVLIMSGVLKEPVINLDTIINKTKMIILAGEIANNVAPVLKEKNCNFAIVKNIKSAVELVEHASCKSKVVLFSPGGASFDAFENYKQRGSYFNSLIQEIEVRS